MTNQKTWNTNQPTNNWSNISEHPASPAWGQMSNLPKSNDEWHLSDIDPSEWMTSEESLDLYEQMDITFETSETREEQFKAMCEQHRNK